VRYEIRVRGHLDGDWAAWFDGRAIARRPGGETRPAGELADEAALHGVLARVRDLGLPLVALRREGDDGAAGDRPGDRR
jgi:hypothetical protein